MRISLMTALPMKENLNLFDFLNKNKPLFDLEQYKPCTHNGCTKRNPVSSAPDLVAALYLSAKNLFKH